MYRCSVCGLAVIVHDGKVHRPCACAGPIVLEIAATVKGSGVLRHVDATNTD